MKFMKSLLKIVFVCLLSVRCFAQSITILTDGITPALAGSIPSLSYDAIIALPSPSIGSLATDLTFKCLRFYDGEKWTKLLSNTDSIVPGINVWSEGGTAGDAGYGIAVDTDGNIYLTGNFSGTAKFGNESLISNGGNDIFVAKYNKSGILQWVKKAGGASSDSGRNLVVDSNGNVFVTGYFAGTANFDNITVTSAGANDVFVAKYNNNGALQWVRKAGGSNDDQGNDLTIDASGNVYIIGDFEGGTFGSKTIVSLGELDIFIVKYTNAGSFEWVRTCGSTGLDNGRGIAMDGSEAIYITGTFSNTIKFGNTSLVSKGNWDIFVAKYTYANDTWVWAKQAGGTNNDIGNDIALDNNGDIWVGGGFQEMATFGNYTQTSLGSYDIFLAKYTSDGNVELIKKYGTLETEYILNLGIDAQDNVYCTGFFNGMMDIGKVRLESLKDNDIFFVKFSPQGMVEWAMSGGGLGSDYPTGIAVEANGNTYATGYFYGWANFGHIKVSGEGLYEAFVIRLRD
jgi:hypothetical protein